MALSTATLCIHTARRDVRLLSLLLSHQLFMQPCTWVASRLPMPPPPPPLQVLIRRDLEESAKVLGERVRSGSDDSEVPSCAVRATSCRAMFQLPRHTDPSRLKCPPATSRSSAAYDICGKRCLSHAQDLFQLGVILLRKKLFTQACRHLEKAKKNWGGDPEELAQVGLLDVIHFLVVNPNPDHLKRISAAQCAHVHHNCKPELGSIATCQPSAWLASIWVRAW